MAVTAESVVVELLARTDDFERKMARAANDFDGNTRRIENSQARIANAQRNLGFQFQDFTSQVASGGSVFTAFAQQAGQASGALADLGGTAGKVGAFLSGPYGSIIIAATAILGNLALAHLSAKDGAEKQKTAEELLADAIKELNDKTTVVNLTKREEIALAEDAARATLVEVKAKREKIKAQLEEIDAQKRFNATFVSAGGAGLTQGTQARTGFREDTLQQQLARQDALVRQADQALARVGVAGQAIAAEERANPLLAIRNRAERQRNILLNSSVVEGRLGPLLDKINADEQAAVERLVASRTKNTERVKATNAKRAPDSDTRLGILQLEQAQTTPLDPARNLLSGLGDTVPEVTLNFEELRDVIDDIRATPLIDPDKVAFVQNFTRDLAGGLANAVVFSGNIGDALVNSFKRAAAEALASGLVRILGGLFGGALGSLFGVCSSGGGFVKANNIVGFAGGGPVSPGQVIRMNETGQELFAPSVPGRIIPAGMANMMMGRNGGPTIYQTIAPQFAGNAATREEVQLMGRLAYEGALSALQQRDVIGVPFQ